MLFLKRIIYPWDWVKCSITGKILRYPEYYYEDDEDGLIVDARHYRKMKREKREAEFDYTRLNNAANEYEYKQMLEEATNQFLADGLMDRKVASYNDTVNGEK